MTHRRSFVPIPHGSATTALAIVLALTSVGLGATCAERDDTVLTSPSEAAEPVPTEAQSPNPIGPPPAPIEPAPMRPEEPAPAPTDPPPTNPVEPVAPTEPEPNIVPPPAAASDACSPVTVTDPNCARAALVPFERRCGTGGLTRSGARGLLRVPYVQRLSDTAVDIVYKRRSGGASDVVVVTSPEGSVVAQAPTMTDPGSSGGRQRLARVEGLSPNTYYCYKVASLTERIGFRTAPAPGGDTPVRFAVFGDSGDGGIGQAAVRDRLLALPIDLILHTGDVAYTEGTVEQFEQNFFRYYEGLLKSVAFFPIAGNHEYDTEGAAPFIEVFDLPDNGGAAGLERWYSFDFGDVHFVGLDTEQLGTEQVEWLDRDLSDNQRPWTVVYFHRPPFSSGNHGSAPDVEQAFVPVLQNHAVPIVFAGHEHSYERTRPIGGVTYVITGGGGKLILPVGTSDFTAKSQSDLHVMDVEVRGRSMAVRAVDVAGVSLDSFELTLPD